MIKYWPCFCLKIYVFWASLHIVMFPGNWLIKCFFFLNVLRRWVMFSWTCKNTDSIVITAQIVKVITDISVSTMCVFMYFPFTEACVKTASSQKPTLGLLSSTLFLYKHFLLQGFISKIPHCLWNTWSHHAGSVPFPAFIEHTTKELIIIAFTWTIENIL